jgi:hypothetical protein
MRRAARPARATLLDVVSGAPLLGDRRPCGMQLRHEPIEQHGLSGLHLPPTLAPTACEGIYDAGNGARDPSIAVLLQPTPGCIGPDVKRSKRRRVRALPGAGIRCSIMPLSVIAQPMRGNFVGDVLRDKPTRVAAVADQGSSVAAPRTWRAPVQRIPRTLAGVSSVSTFSSTAAADLRCCDRVSAPDPARSATLFGEDRGPSTKHEALAYAAGASFWSRVPLERLAYNLAEVPPGSSSSS